MKLISALGTALVFFACGYQASQVNAATATESAQSPQENALVENFLVENKVNDKSLVERQQVDSRRQADNHLAIVGGNRGFQPATPPKGDQQMTTGIFEGQLTSEPSAKGLSVRLTIHNPRQHGVAVQYRSGMTADLWLVDAQGKQLWAWSSTMMFTQALRDTVVAADRTFSVNFTIPQAVLSQMPEGTIMQAKYAGFAQEINQPAMADIKALLPMRLMVR